MIIIKIIAVLIVLLLLCRVLFLVVISENKYTYKEYVVPLDKNYSDRVFQGSLCFIRIAIEDQDKKVENQHKQLLDTSGIWDSFWRSLTYEEEEVINKFLKEHPDFERDQAVED